MVRKEIDIQNKKICHHCIDEEYLSTEIKKKGEKGQCTSCNRNTETFSLNVLARRIENVILSHYEITPNEPDSWQERLLHDDESDFYWEREGKTFQELLDDDFGINSIAASTISNYLNYKYYDIEAAKTGEETHFGRDVHYQLKSNTGELWFDEWNTFKKILKTEARFFNEKVEKILKSIFKGIESNSTITRESVITRVKKNDESFTLYRARVFQSSTKLLAALCNPDILLGPPPSSSAANGRLNAQGISVFYGSTDQNTAIAEVRPPVGSKVAIARFKIIKTLKLLDLRKLKSINSQTSVFDPLYSEKMEKYLFLSQLGALITRPVMPEDEVQEYLSTQAVADYLASRKKFKFDGIIFPSVQVQNGVNITLFHKSSFVEIIKLKNGTSLEATDKEYEETDYYTSYQVFEKISKKSKKKHNIKEKETAISPSLRIDLESIHVHHIESVKYSTSKYLVDRIVIDESDFDPF